VGISIDEISSAYAQEKGISLSLASPLSHGQQALWVLQQLTPEGGVYNEAVVLRIKTQLDVDVVRYAILKLVERHPVLRTRYPLQDNKPIQEIMSPFAVSVQVVESLCHVK